MKRINLRSIGVLAAVAASLSLSAAPIATTGAAGAARHDVRATQHGRARPEYYFFHGGAGGGAKSFVLQGGEYWVDVWARYNAAHTSGAACFFAAHLDGVEHYMPQAFSALDGGGWSVDADTPWHDTPTILAARGHYRLVVSPLTDCDWSVDVVRVTLAHPAILINAVNLFHVAGHTLTPFHYPAVVHTRETFECVVYYSVIGATTAPVTATLTLSQGTQAVATFRPLAGTDTYGGATFSQALIITPGGKGNTLTAGPATATFTVTLGGAHPLDTGTGSIAFTYVT